MPQRRSVRVPGSSANLGPGFDALGLALAVYLECDFEKAVELRISAEGRDAGSIPLDATNLIWRTACRVATANGHAMPPVNLAIRNGIPIGKGLGSSATALVAGVVIASETLELGWDAHRILDEAARLEGHPDNVAASVLGSITTAAIDSAGITRAIRIDMPANIRAAVVCPNFELATNFMRTVLPECYTREDAIFNLQRATLLVAGLATGNREAFPEAFRDRFHQPYRMKMVPGMEEILNLRAPGLLGCALSGAGPAILVFYEEGRETVLELVRERFHHAGRASEIVVRDVDRDGLRIS